MWYIIETGLGLKIPAYLKNIMRLESYDTPTVIKNMTTGTFEELEHFGRTKMLKFIKKDEKISNYFDKYHICPSEFKISAGHKILLSEIQKFIADKLSTNKMYFTPESRLEKSKSECQKLRKNTTSTMN